MNFEVYFVLLITLFGFYICLFYKNLALFYLFFIVFLMNINIFICNNKKPFFDKTAAIWGITINVFLAESMFEFIFTIV